MRNHRSFHSQRPEEILKRIIEDKILWPAERKFFEILSTAFSFAQSGLELCAAPLACALKKIAGKNKQRPS